jgi:hypothetical protein
MTSCRGKQPLLLPLPGCASDIMALAAPTTCAKDRGVCCAAPPGCCLAAASKQGSSIWRPSCPGPAPTCRGSGLLLLEDMLLTAQRLPAVLEHRCCSVLPRWGGVQGGTGAGCRSASWKVQGQQQQHLWWSIASQQRRAVHQLICTMQH